MLSNRYSTNRGLSYVSVLQNIFILTIPKYISYISSKFLILIKKKTYSEGTKILYQKKNINKSYVFILCFFVLCLNTKFYIHFTNSGFLKYYYQHLFLMYFFVLKVNYFLFLSVIYALH